MAGCDFTFGVYIPSYNRYARGMITGKLFEDPKHVVRKSQEKQYAEHGFKNIVSVDDRLVDGYSDVYNWIVENVEADVIAIVDDDVLIAFIFKAACAQSVCCAAHEVFVDVPCKGVP